MTMNRATAMDDSSHFHSADPRVGFFDRIAAAWDHDEQDPLDTLRRVEQNEHLLGLRSGERVLEVGCGTGQLTDWITQRVHPGRVVAVDFSPRMLANARAKNIDAEFRQADVCGDALGEACFDAVLCFHSFPHFRDQAAALANLARAMAPDGRLLVMHLNDRAAINAYHDQVGGEVAGDHLPDVEQWDALLATAGLRRTEWLDREGLFLLRAVRQ